MGGNGTLDGPGPPARWIFHCPGLKIQIEGTYCDEKVPDALPGLWPLRSVDSVDFLPPRLVGFFVQVEVVLLRIDALDHTPEIACQMPGESAEAGVVHAQRGPLVDVVDEQLSHAGVPDPVVVDDCAPGRQTGRGAAQPFADPGTACSGTPWCFRPWRTRGPWSAPGWSTGLASSVRGAWRAWV